VALIAGARQPEGKAGVDSGKVLGAGHCHKAPAAELFEDGLSNLHVVSCAHG